MATIFISHSSKDNAEAAKLRDWLRENDFTALFLDFDDDDGIKPGRDWEKTLYREVRRSQAVLLLLTEHWHASKWCFAEYTQARALGKVVIPLRLQEGLKERVAADVQNLDLFHNDAAARAAELQRLHAELIEITVNTQHGLKWDTQRAPYPGMMAFEAEDAPVFFGRDADIKRLRERLTGCRIHGSASLVVMLAASGAGKSSVLKAGLLPRLRRDAANWMVLPAVRPEKAPLVKLAQQLATKVGDAATWQALYRELQGEQALAALERTLNTLKTRSQQWDATLLISIDQAEELFSTADPQETTQLLALLTAAEAAGLSVITLLALRSDYLPALQNHAGLTHGEDTLNKALFPLEPLPLERVGELIRGPAAVAGLVVDDGLITAASQDADTDDALPLLAFALRELYDRYGDDGDLTLDEYKRLGSDTLTPLENAVQRKAQEALQAADPNEADLQALREAFIPHMVRINDAGDYVRQPARWLDVPEQARGLLDKLTNARLLIQRQNTDNEKTVEVAHEALLRHWQLLNGWLTEEHDFLLGKQQLEHSLREWDDLPDADKDMGLLQGIALQRAQEWLFTNRSGLTDAERDFIRQSHQAEEARRAAEEQRRKQQRNRLIGFSIVVLIVAALAVWQAISARAAEQQAEAQSQRAELARSQAEGVINFMVFDLRDKLKPIGRLDIMRDVQERVNTYYETSGEQQSTEARRRTATNRLQFADTLESQGNLTEAETAYREALAIFQENADSEPDNPAWQRDLSFSLERIGDILSAQGQLEEAKNVHEQRLAIAEKLAADDPSNAGWQRDLSVSLNKIGDILRAQGKLEEAKQVFEQSRAIREKLAADDPSNAGWHRDLSFSLERIGDILSAQGQLEEAKNVHEQRLVIAEKLAADDPSNAGWQRDLSVSLERIGKIQEAQGKLDGAISSYRQSIEIMKPLADADPSNAGWQRHISVTMELIAGIHLEKDEWDQAANLYQQQLDIVEKLRASDPSNVGWQTTMISPLTRLFLIESQKGNIAAARKHGEQALAILRPLAEQGLLHGDQQQWIGALEGMMTELEN